MTMYQTATVLIVSFIASNAHGIFENPFTGSVVSPIFSRPTPSNAVVSIENFRGLHICNGILIKEDVVLTAAHCVNEIETLKVRANSKIVGFGGQVIAVQKNCPIRDFNFVTKHNDIAVLRLASPVDGATHAKLPIDDIPDRIKGTVQGWGFNTHGSLLAVPAIGLRDEDCKRIYGETAVTESMECLEYLTIRNSCLDGAQGSAVLVKDTVVAINAALGVCGPQGPPGVFTKIPVATIQEDIDACV